MAASSEPRFLPPDPAALARVLRRLGAAAAPPWLHGEVARRMAERLPIIRIEPRRIVEWWGFLGASDSVLKAAYPAAHRVAAEPTDALLQRSRQALASPWWSVRRWQPGSRDAALDSEIAPGSADLLWSNMMLAAATDLPACLARWHRVLAVDGFVMFSCLGPDSLRELRAIHARRGWPAPGLAFPDMHDIGDLLVHAGFADPVMDQERLTLTWADGPALLAELRGLGGNLSVSRPPGLRGRDWLRQLLGDLRAGAGADGRIGVTFEIVYGHAFKAAPRPVPPAETTVSLDAMRAMVRRPGRRDA